MIKCTKCGAELSDTAKFCKNCGERVEQNNANGIKEIAKGKTICPNPNCKTELPSNAKFCNKCGASISGTKKCPQCKTEQPFDAKFCNKCGHRFIRLDRTEDVIATAIEGREGIRTVGEATAMVGGAFEDVLNGIAYSDGFVRWRVQKGQLAVRITERAFDSYKTARGIIIDEGTRAIFFVDGKKVGELGAGRYDMLGKEVQRSAENEKEISRIAQDKTVKPESEKKGLWGLIKERFYDIPKEKFAASNELKREEVLEAAEKRRAEFSGAKKDKNRLMPHTFVVLMRSAQFPLIYTTNENKEKDIAFYNMPTANVRSTISAHIVAEVTDLLEFYANHLLDSEYVSLEGITAYLKQNIEYVIKAAVKDVALENIDAAKVLAALQKAFAEQCPYINIKRLFDLTAENKHIEDLRRRKEELYVSEKKLEEIQLRWDFMNRLQSAENAQELKKVQTKADFDLAMRKILFAQEQEANKITLDETQERSDFGIAKDKIADKEDELRLIMATAKFAREAKTDDEKEALTQQYLKNGILREEEMSVLSREIEQRARMAELNDEAAYDMAALKNKRAYDEEQLNWEIAIGNKQREIQFDRERKQAEHEVGTDRIKTEYSDERRAKDAQFEDERKRAAMDLENEERNQRLERLKRLQDIRTDRENAAHARKMEAENTARQHEFDMQKLLSDTELGKIQSFKEMTFEQIMAANPNISREAAQALGEKFKAQAAGASTEEMKEFMLKQQGMTMELMQQILGNQKNADKEALAAKQREIDFVKDTAKTEQDRYMTGVTTAISSVSGAFAGEKKTDEGKICPKCNTKNSSGAVFCENCGEKL